MKSIILIVLVLVLMGCKSDPGDDYETELIEINIEQIRIRCDGVDDVAEHDQCMMDYARALSRALSEYINVQVYGGGYE